MTPEASARHQAMLQERRQLRRADHPPAQGSSPAAAAGDKAAGRTVLRAAPPALSPGGGSLEMVGKDSREAEEAEGEGQRVPAAPAAADGEHDETKTEEEEKGEKDNDDDDEAAAEDFLKSFPEAFLLHRLLLFHPLNRKVCYSPSARDFENHAVTSFQVTDHGLLLVGFENGCIVGWNWRNGMCFGTVLVQQGPPVHLLGERKGQVWVQNHQIGTIDFRPSVQSLEVSWTSLRAIQFGPVHPPPRRHVDDFLI